MNIARRQDGLHLEISGKIALMTLLRPLGAGASPSQIMLQAENVLVDLMVSLGGSDDTLDVMVAGVRKRVAEVRRTIETTEGST